MGAGQAQAPYLADAHAVAAEEGHGRIHQLVLALVLAGVRAVADLAPLLGASAEVATVGSGYARILLGGCGTVMLLFVINAIFRGAHSLKGLAGMLISSCAPRSSSSNTGSRW